MTKILFIYEKNRYQKSRATVPLIKVVVVLRILLGEAGGTYHHFILNNLNTDQLYSQLL